MDFDELDREEVDRRYEDVEQLEIVVEAFMQTQACPCICRVTRRCMVGGVANTASPENSYSDDVEVGSFIRLLQMEHVVQEHTVRGRIENPEGWITLLTAWNEETTVESLEEASVGVYEVTNIARVTTTLSLLPSDGCKDIGDLHEGTIVRVLEVDLAHDERRIRGRIEHPYVGWISILNTENGYRWAERREKGTEVPLLRLADIEVGATLHLLSNPDALTVACQELGSLTPEQCVLAIGAEVTVLEVDLRYERLRCRVPLFGEEWYAMSCFVHTSSEVEDLPDLVPPDVGKAGRKEEEPPRRPKAFSSLASKVAPQREEEVPSTAIVQASSSPPAPAPLPFVEPEPTESEAKALAELIRNSRPAPEVEVSALVVHDPAVAAPAPREERPAKEFYSLEDFPVGCLVETSDSMALRSGEMSISRELLHLDKGHLCAVLEHSAGANSRRMRVRETKKQWEGWISCATKAGRPLVSFVAARAGGAVPMPSIDEVLAKIDEDDDDPVEEDLLPGRHRVSVAEAEPDDPVLVREKAEEAVAVWRGFSDLALLDTADEIRGREESAMGLEVRRHELMKWGGWDNPAEEQVTMAEDRRLRFMETQLLKREERDRKLKDRLQRAMAKQMAGSQPMPKSRAIVRRNAPPPPGQLGSAASSRHAEQHLAIEDMRQRLEEERLETAELQMTEAAEEAGMSLEEVIQASREKAAAMDAEWEAAQAHEDANYDEPYIEPGSLVRVCGLKGVAELNDLEGMVERWDAKTERWVVRLQNGQCKKLREENLLPCEDLDEEEDGAAAADEDSGGADGFSGAPFAVSMRQGHTVPPPKGDVSHQQRPWYAPWMVPTE